MGSPGPCSPGGFFLRHAALALVMVLALVPPGRAAATGNVAASLDVGPAGPHPGHLSVDVTSLGFSEGTDHIVLDIDGARYWEFTLPASVHDFFAQIDYAPTEGYHTYHLLADADHALAETDESDNEVTQTWLISDARPDLVVTLLDAHADGALSGTSVTWTYVVSARVCNDGLVATTAATNFTAFVWHRGTNLDPATRGVWAQTDVLPGTLDVGACLDHTVRIPGSALTQGDYSVEAQASTDVHPYLAELDWWNNHDDGSFQVLGPSVV